MNWEIFGILWGTSLLTKWLSEYPDSFMERLFIGLIYTAACIVVGLAVPAELTEMGLLIYAVPFAGDISIKVYRHIVMSKLEKQYGPASD